MKKIILSILVVFVCGNLKSQNWFQNDAVWHYTHFGAGVLDGYIKVEYKNDTIFSGHIWKQFTNKAQGVDLSASNAPYNYNYNSIFLRDSLGIQFAKVNGFSDTIYDFTKSIGDSIYLNTNGGCYKGVVFNTGIISVNSFALPYQVIDYSECVVSSSFTLRDTIIQYVGSIKYFLHPFYTFDIPLTSLPDEFGFFRCFQDSIIGTYIRDNFWATNSCEWNLSVAEVMLLNNYSLYPNPSEGFVTIQFDKPVFNPIICVINSLGEPILRTSFGFGKDLQFNISNQPRGIYFVSIKINDHLLTQKIVLK